MSIERGHIEEQRAEDARPAEPADAERKADDLDSTSDQARPDAAAEPSPAELKAQTASDAPSDDDVQREPEGRHDIPGTERFEETGAKVAERLSSERWEQADLADRESIAHETHDVIREEYGLPPGELQVTDLEDGVDGEYDPAKRSVSIDRSTLEGDRPDRMLDTIAHENRHDVQQRIMDGDMEHPHGGFGARETELWGKGADDYGNSGLFADYAYNPLETDARAAGSGVVNGWLRVELDRARGEGDPS
jgi:hypothetical protein